MRYEFLLPGGKIEELSRPMGEQPKYIVRNGKRCFQVLQGANVGIVGIGSVNSQEHLGLGVHPRQIPELQRLLKSRGVRPTEFNPKTGDCKVQNRSHLNEIMIARGMRSSNGGYGDWCGH